MMKSVSWSTLVALLLISPRFPIGVATMYKLLSRPLFLILLLFIFYSCTPRIIVNEDISTKESDKGELEKIDKKEVDEVDIDQKVAEINQTSSDPLYINPYSNKKIESEVKKEVIELCSKFPIDNHLKKD